MNNDWNEIDFFNNCKENEALIVTDEYFNCFYIISSNDFIKWKKDNKHKVDANIGLVATIDLKFYKWVKVL
jgi:hypothetical protein